MFRDSTSNDDMPFEKLPAYVFQQLQGVLGSVRCMNGSCLEAFNGQTIFPNPAGNFVPYVAGQFWPVRFVPLFNVGRVNVQIAAHRSGCVSDKSSDPGTNAVDEFLSAIGLFSRHAKQGLNLERSILLGRFGDSAASLFSFGLFASTVGFLMGGFLTRLGNVSSALGKILTLVLLLVDDFFVVRYISWIGHPQP